MSVTIPLWALVAGFFGLPVAGFLVCAVLTAGAMADLRGDGE